MHIFVIPSWYPNSSAPSLGSFIFEQVRWMAQFNNEHRYSISLWGHTGSELSPRHPIQSLFRILRWAKERSGVSEVSSNCAEFYTPALYWTPKIPGGGLQRLVKACESNLKASQQKFGKVDVIHAHVSFPSGFIAAELGKKWGLPIVLTEHMGPFPFPEYRCENGKLIFQMDHAFRSADRIQAVSHSLLKQIIQYGYSAVTVIPNFIKTDEIHKKVQSAFEDKDPQQIRLLFMGGDSEIKGISLLIKALAILNTKKFDYHLTVLGLIQDPIVLQQKLQKLGLQNLVQFLGKLDRESVKSNFSKYDILVLPSQYESFGIVCVEALAAGIPVVATRCGGPEEIINSEVGILTEQNPESFASGVEQVVSRLRSYDPQKLREYAESRYSVQVVVPKILKLYESVIRGSVCVE